MSLWGREEKKQKSEIMEKTYWCTDYQGYGIEIKANSPKEAAEEYVAAGEWGESDYTFWITVVVSENNIIIDSIKVPVHPIEPDCIKGKHQWKEIGMWGNGAGIISKDKCTKCGLYRKTNSYAQDPYDGEQGLYSIEYQIEL